MLEVKLKRKLPGFTLDVDFKVDQEILAILGPSGSGKTMTLQCIAGLLQPDSGFVNLNGKVIYDSAHKIDLPVQMRKVGFVFQNYALFPHLTVTQNIAYGIRHLPPKDCAQKVAQQLDKMNILRLADRFPRQLSAGQQQRVAMARALAPEPDLLLLDEPFSALDSMVKERLQLELQALHQFYPGNVLFVTHDLAEGYKLGSKIAVFESGKIIQCDEKEKVISCPSRHTVARLVGFKNLLEGKVIEIKGRQVTIEVTELGGLIDAQLRNDDGLKIGQKVTIGIRPEYVRITSTPGPNRFLSTVDRVTEGVSSNSLYFHIDAVGTTRHYMMVTCARNESLPFQENKSCFLHLPAEHITIITE